MFKVGLTALLTAAACLAIAAATGFGAGSPKVVDLQLHEITSLKGGNFHCEVLTKTEVACGSNSLPNSVQVYFAPHELAVLKFNSTGKKFAQLYAAKR
jgi:hypothetical protein